MNEAALWCKLTLLGISTSSPLSQKVSGMAHGLFVELW